MKKHNNNNFSAHQTGKKMKAIDNIAKTFDFVIFFIKSLIIPVITWQFSDNTIIRIFAIICYFAISLREYLKK